jgi:multicomponent Na+:H+ antiporter subunit B
VTSPRDLELAVEEPLHRRWLGLVVVLALLGCLLAALLRLPRGDNTLPAIARRALVDSLPAFGTTEPVSAVVYGFRAMDTFGETFLLLAAVLSVTVLARPREPRHGFVGEERAASEEQREVEQPEHESAEQRRARRAERAEEGAGEGPELPDEEPVGSPAPERAQAMTAVTRFAVRLAIPLLAVAGLYLVVQGYSPGGGFPAGAVALGVVLLVHAAFGYGRVAGIVRPGVLEPLELAAGLAIVVVLFLGLPLAGSFAGGWVPLAPPQTLRSGGIVQVFSLTELVEVGGSLVLAVFALIGMRHDWASDEDDDS